MKGKEKKTYKIDFIDESRGLKEIIFEKYYNLGIKIEMKKIINKKINKNISKNNKFKRNYNSFLSRIIFSFLVLLNISFSKSIDNKSNLLNYKISEITLKIKGDGFRDILGNKRYAFNKDNYPDEIYINGIKQDLINSSYFFNETDNYIKLEWNKGITACAHMFRECKDITEINLTNFISSSITSTHAMFYNCQSLTSVIFANFNTSNVKDMYSMFRDCKSLTSLNLSHFDTSNVSSNREISSGMHAMFMGCTELTSLDISNFNINKIISLNSMFRDCKSLVSIDLSHFNTSNITSMTNMFYNCKSLTSLNLSNFDTSKIKNITNMFYGCTSLKYINLKNYNENSNIENYNNIFNDIPNNVVICINDNTNFKIYNQIKEILCYTIDCSDEWILKQKKYNNETKRCINNYNYYTEYSINDYNSNSYNNYSNIDENVASNLLDKECYYTCKTCEIMGDNKTHNCLECNSDFYFRINFNNYINCYKSCEYYYYFDNDNKYYYCTINSSCQKEYSKLLKDKNECIKYDLKILLII